MKNQLSAYFINIIIIFVILGCANKPAPLLPVHHQSQIEREQLLAQLDGWEVRGKIAFIQESKRESASFNWQKSKNEQKVDLTTYLGISIFSLHSQGDFHAIEVNGETYRGSNLDQLIYQLTELSLPAEVLPKWLLGLKNKADDNLVLEPDTQLPKKMTSLYNNQTWHVTYNGYTTKMLNNVPIQLARKLTITTDGLVIKIAINQWNIK